MTETYEQKTGYGKKPLWYWIVIYVIIGAIVYGLLYYFVLAKKGGYNSQSSQYLQPTTEQATTAPASDTQAPSPATTVKQISVEGNEFSFTPSTITLKKDEAVQITFKNIGKYPHNFVISDLNVQSSTIKPGEETSVTFTPNKTGQFTYICSVPGHADKGMTGTLTVE